VLPAAAQLALERTASSVVRVASAAGALAGRPPPRAGAAARVAGSAASNQRYACLRRYQLRVSAAR